jgi:HopA1 effector protein family
MLSLNLTSPDLLEILEEIASNITIHSGFKITHPNYQSLELTAAEANSLQQLPREIQNKYLNLQLRTFIHSIYFDGSLKPTITDEVNNKAETLTLENNTVRGINNGYYTALESNNCGSGFYEPGWVITGKEGDDLLIVQKDDLTLHVEQYRNLQHGEVAVLMPKDRLELGYYIAVGNAGFASMHHTNPSVNIYFNFTPEAAPTIVQALTQQLNAIDIPFSFKVAYDLDQCLHHYDSGILNIEKSDYFQVVPILQQIYGVTDFCHEIPLFTKYLAPGLGLAEVPETESFGMNRCRIMANALLDAYHDENDTPSTRISSIKQHFAKMNISLQSPYLNPDSQDIYQFA